MTIKIMVLQSSKMLVCIYETTWHHIPEDSRLLKNSKTEWVKAVVVLTALPSQLSQISVPRPVTMTETFHNFLCQGRAKNEAMTTSFHKLSKSLFSKHPLCNTIY